MAKQFKSFTHYARIEKGKLVLNNERYFNGMIQLFADTNVRVIVERIKGVRTNQQNRYYRGVVLYLIAQHTGYLEEELHKVMRSKFLKEKRVWRGDELTILQSTKELTTDEFAEYIDQVCQEGAELGIEIPSPDKNWSTKEQFPEAYPDYTPMKQLKN